MSTTFRLGAFIVLGLLIFAIGIFLIGDKQSLFSSTYLIKAEFQNVSGLIDGADVRVGGLHKGTVRRIDLPHHPGEKVVVLMDLEKATRDVIRKDSIASIKSEGLLGDKYAEISFGSPEADKIQNGETIASAPPTDFAELVAKTDQLLDSAKSTVQNLDVTSGNLKSVSTKIDQGEGTLGALVNDKSVYQQATAGSAAFRDNMEALKNNFLLRGFFSKRGYKDSDELAKYEIDRLPSDRYTRAFMYDATKLFDRNDTAKLKNEKVLQEAGRFLEREEFGLAVVVASMAKGETDKQRTLTEARTMVVRKYLAENFRLDDTRIKTMGLGKSQPDSLDDAGDRVEILVYPIGSKIPVAQAATRNGK